MATLILMRHGKSGYPAGVADHERPLADRGRRQAAAAGQWIRDHLGDVGEVICSTSTRTRQTLAAAGFDGVPVRYESAVYGGDADDISTEIALTDPTVSTLMVVGHEPGIPWTALELADNADSDEARWIRSGFPTSALAVLRVDVPWPDLGAGRAHLLHALRLD